MDAHPIPQDVTGFQFKLIGDMTIKQFAYIIVGVIFAWIFFSLPVTSFIKLPFALFFICFGASLAFLPLEGRPLDLMVTYFFKALISPNQFLFIKSGAQIIPPLPRRNYQPSAKEQPKTMSEENLQTLLASTSAYTPKNELDKKETLYLQSVSSILKGGTYTPPSPVLKAIQTQTPATSFPSAPIQPVTEKKEEKLEESIKPEDDVEEVEQELEEQTQILAEELKEAKEDVQKEEVKGASNQQLQEANIRVTRLEQLLNETILQKNQLEQQLLSLQKQLDIQKNQPLTPPLAPNVPKTPKNTIKNTGLSAVMENPNLIAGIIKDPRGNVLPNILVEIRDQEGNPVRAFKTNKLGQFASATPLLNGNYTIVFEDPSEANKFENMEIIAQGGFIPPLEVISRDAREELRKSLFSA